MHRCITLIECLCRRDAMGIDGLRCYASRIGVVDVTGVRAVRVGRRVPRAPPSAGPGNAGIGVFGVRRRNSRNSGNSAEFGRIRRIRRNSGNSRESGHGTGFRENRGLRENLGGSATGVPVDEIDGNCSSVAGVRPVDREAIRWHHLWERCEGCVKRRSHRWSMLTHIAVSVNLHW